MEKLFLYILVFLSLVVDVNAQEPVVPDSLIYGKAGDAPYSITRDGELNEVDSIWQGQESLLNNNVAQPRSDTLVIEFQGVSGVRKKISSCSQTGAA